MVLLRQEMVKWWNCESDSGLPETHTSFQDLERPTTKSTAATVKRVYEKKHLYFLSLEKHLYCLSLENVWRMFCRKLYSFQRAPNPALRKSQLPVLDRKSKSKQLSMSLISFLTKPPSIREAISAVKINEKIK